MTAVLVASGMEDNNKNNIVVICKKELSSQGLEFFNKGGTYNAFEDLNGGFLFVYDNNENKHIIAQSAIGEWENDSFLNEHFEIIYYSKHYSFNLPNLPTSDMLYGMEGIQQQENHFQ